MSKADAFCSEAGAAVERELRAAFDSLVEHLRQSRKLLQRKEKKLSLLEDACLVAIRADTASLQAMCEEAVPFEVVEEDKQDSKSSGQEELSELVEQVAHARAELESLRARRQAMESAAVVKEAEAEALPSAKDLVLYSLQGKRLKRLSQCSQQLCRRVSGSSSSEDAGGLTLEQRIDAERRGMPSRSDLQHLDDLLGSASRSTSKQH